jgi:hypothetical protein
MNLKGSIVLLFIISGTILVFVESIGVSMPFTFAVFFPIQSSMVVPFRVMVTFFSEESQLIVPPNASTIALIGTRVIPFLMTGGESNVFDTPFTVKFVFPI